jgi:hypothetical protein
VGENKMKTENETQGDLTIAKLKLADAHSPGFLVDVDPDEADILGAFVEDALTEQDAMDGCVDLLDVELDDSRFNQEIKWGLA